MNMKKQLVAYFSRAGENYVGGNIQTLAVGNTKVAADMILELTDADEFQIEPVIPYSESYMTCIDEAKKDLQEGVRPELKSYLESIDGYDTIYLAYPNYWGTMPMAMWTFLERYDFSGKVIRPLCTHEGSGMGHSEADIRRLCPGAVVTEGLPITGGSVATAKPQIKHWVEV